MTAYLKTPDGRWVTLQFGSRVARLLGGLHNALTLSATLIWVGDDVITAKGLAHEIGHTYQAARLGWRYFPWVLWCYLTQGYTRSDPEVEADVYMVRHVSEYPPLTY